MILALGVTQSQIVSFCHTQLSWLAFEERTVTSVARDVGHLEDAVRKAEAPGLGEEARRSHLNLADALEYRRRPADVPRACKIRAAVLQTASSFNMLTCVICLGTMQPNEPGITSLRFCHHTFHRSCLEPILRGQMGS